MNEALSDVHERLLAAIAAVVGPNGELADALTGTPSPSDHYGHCSAALALALAHPDDWPRAMQLVRTWVGLDSGRIGHLPFNRLMLGMLTGVARTRETGADDVTLIESGLARCTLKPDYPSNNWGLLAQTCRVLEAQGDARELATAQLCTLLQRWTTDAGAFIDFPADPNLHDRFSTPIAYHHKALFLTALAARHHPDPQLLRHLHRLLDWLVHCWDPAGYAGGFGRSNHALFGDACLLGALILIGHDTEGADTPVDALARRLSRQQRADGLLWLDPAGPVTADAAWDNYMRLSVYNAWTAALIGLARHLGPIAAESLTKNDVEWGAARPGLFHDEQAGILCLRGGDGASLMMSTRGQAPQAFSREEVELRYAGGVIFHLNDATPLSSACHHAPLVAPPVRIARKLLLQTPVLAGWVPMFEHGGVLYGLTDFDVIRCAGGAETSTPLEIRLSGQPTALTRKTPSGVWQSLVAAIDWRLFGGRLGRRTAHKRAALDAVRAELEVLATLHDTAHMPPGADAAKVTLVVALTIVVAKTGAVRYLNPAGFQLAGECRVASALLPAQPPSSLPHASARAQESINLTVGTHTFRIAMQHDGIHWQVE